MDGWRIGLHLLDGVPVALVPLLALVSGTALVYSLSGAVAAAIFRIITELKVFVVQGWSGDIAAGLGTVGADRRS